MVGSWPGSFRAEVARAALNVDGPAVRRRCFCGSIGGWLSCQLEKQGGLQIVFDRGISDRHINQSSTLETRYETVVLDRIEGDATIAPPQHAIIFGAKSSGGVPVRMHDPFER